MYICRARPHVLLVVLNKPHLRNSLAKEDQYELERLFIWFDKEASLRWAVVTGAGDAFCAGGDLREWDEFTKERKSTRDLVPRNGSGGLTRRLGKKPVIAAVNGAALGAGLRSSVEWISSSLREMQLLVYLKSNGAWCLLPAGCHGSAGWSADHGLWNSFCSGNRFLQTAPAAGV